MSAAPPARAEEAPIPAMPVDQLVAGQRGYGLSVFAGTEPERFEAEIIGVLRNVNPDMSYVLARLSGRDLEHTGVSRGMSGSPVYVDGKLVGAVSAAWPFAKEAIALVMPIESMRRVRGSKAPMARATAAFDTGERLRQLATGELPKGFLAETLGALAPPRADGASSGVGWSASGFGDPTLGLLRTALGGISPAGQAAETAPKDLVPGGAVAMVLIDGDLRMAATGTVTDRTGDEILAFGHPFLGMGPLSAPMAPAEVLMVLASQQISFKMSNFGTPIGAFDEDRAPALHGRIGAVAPTVPMVVEVGGRRYQMRLAAVPQILPPLVSIAGLGALDAAGHAAGEQGFDLDLKMTLRGHGELRLRQSFDGPQAAFESATFLAAVTGFLAGNPLAEVDIDAVELSFAHSERPRTATITGAHAERTVVRPGDRVTVNVDFLGYRGAAFRRAIEVTVPNDSPEGRYSLFVGDGATIDGVRFDLEPAAPHTFGQALELVRSLHSRRELVALGVFAGRGLAVAGHVLPRLPGSVRSLWAAAASGSAVPLRAALAQQVVEPLDVPAQGGVRIDLEVRRRDALTGENGGAATTSPPATPAAAPGRQDGGR